MQTITLNVVAYNTENGKVWNKGNFDNRAMPLGSPIPRVGEKYQYQVWSFEVFDVSYAYNSDATRVTIYVWMEPEIANKIFSTR